MSINLKQIHGVHKTNGFFKRNGRMIGFDARYTAHSGVFNITESALPKLPITDGLYCWVDAEIKGSYPGSGTTWYDLSDRGFDGTLSHEAIGTTTAGTMDFNGSNHWIDFDSPNRSGSDYTVAGVSKRHSGTGRLFSGGNNWLMGHWSSFIDTCYCEGWITPSSGLPNDTNYHSWINTGDHSADSRYFYNNGTDKTTSSTGGSQGPNGFNLGRYYLGSEYGDGDIPVMYVYNRVLTSAERTYTNNMLMERFNIT